MTGFLRFTAEDVPPPGGRPTTWRISVVGLRCANRPNRDKFPIPGGDRSTLDGCRGERPVVAGIALESWNRAARRRPRLRCGADVPVLPQPRRRDAPALVEGRSEGSKAATSVALSQEECGQRRTNAAIPVPAVDRAPNRCLGGSIAALVGRPTNALDAFKPQKKSPWQVAERTASDMHDNQARARMACLALIGRRNPRGFARMSRGAAFSDAGQVARCCASRGAKKSRNPSGIGNAAV
jgi:hypothetical protein